HRDELLDLARQRAFGKHLLAEGLKGGLGFRRELATLLGDLARGVRIDVVTHFDGLPLRMKDRRRPQGRRDRAWSIAEAPHTGLEQARDWIGAFRYTAPIRRPLQRPAPALPRVRPRP